VCSSDLADFKQRSVSITHKSKLKASGKLTKLIS